MAQKVSNASISRFSLDSSDATLIVAIVGVASFLLGIFMGVLL